MRVGSAALRTALVPHAGVRGGKERRLDWEWALRCRLVSALYGRTGEAE